MNQFPPFLENLIQNYLKAQFLKKSHANKAFTDKDYIYFAKGAERLSLAYTSDRGSLPANYLNDPVLHSGYLLYFLPVNFLKIVRILNEFSRDELVEGKVRILDLGAGPGTSMLGTQYYYSELLKKKWVRDAWLDFTLIDVNYGILKDAKYFHDAYLSHLAPSPPSTPSTLLRTGFPLPRGGRVGERVIPRPFHSECHVNHFDLSRGNLGGFLRNFKYHLIILSNFLNERKSLEEKVAVVEELIVRHLDPRGKLVIIEPALRQTSRELQSLRDELVLKKKRAHIFAPCFHQEVCPLNAMNRDWCHFYLPWDCPPIVAKTDRLIGNKKEWLAMSYLVLGKSPSPFGERVGVRGSGQSWRVISNVMRTKGKKEVVLCGPPGRYHLRRLDKNRSVANREYDRIQRGDVISVDVGAGNDFMIDGQRDMGVNDQLKVVRKL